MALRFIRSSRGLGCKTSGGRLLCTDRSGTETSPTSKNAPGIYRSTACQFVKSEKKGSSLDNLPDPDFYLHRERIRQLYTELYKEKNITKFRNTKISIERKVAA